METALDSLVAKLARVPDAPSPEFPYSANVTWSVLHTIQSAFSVGSDCGGTYRVSLSDQTFQPAATTFEWRFEFWKTTRA